MSLTETRRIEIQKEMSIRFKRKKPIDDLINELRGIRKTEKSYTADQKSLCSRIYRGREWLKTHESDKQYAESLKLYQQLVDEAWNKYLIREEEAWIVGEQNPVKNIFGEYAEEIEGEVSDK